MTVEYRNQFNRVLSTVVLDSDLVKGVGWKQLRKQHYVPLQTAYLVLRLDCQKNDPLDDELCRVFFDEINLVELQDGRQESLIFETTQGRQGIISSGYYDGGMYNATPVRPVRCGPTNILIPDRLCPCGPTIKGQPCQPCASGCDPEDCNNNGVCNAE